MTSDESFAEQLREHAARVAPPLSPDTSRVLARARRRRRTTRSLGTAGLAVAVVAVGWGAAAQVPLAHGPWAPGTGTSVSPAGEGPQDETREEARPSTGSEDTTVEDTAVEQAGGTYWYSRIIHVERDDEEQSEQWRSREVPGLLVFDGDLESATGIGPVDVLGRFRIDGAWVDMLRDPAALPTDAAELQGVLEDSVEPDRGGGTPEEKVFDMALNLLREGELLPGELRAAAWEVARGLPGSSTSPGSDTLDRQGQVLERTLGGEPMRLVVDPATFLVLEWEYGGVVSTVVEERFVDDVPVEPTLENAGCADWSTC